MIEIAIHLQIVRGFKNIIVNGVPSAADTCAAVEQMGGLYAYQGTTRDGKAFYANDKYYLFFDKDCYVADDGDDELPTPRWLISNKPPSTSETHNLDGDGKCSPAFTSDSISESDLKPPSDAEWLLFCAMGSSLTGTLHQLMIKPGIDSDDDNKNDDDGDDDDDDDDDIIVTTIITAATVATPNDGVAASATPLATAYDDDENSVGDDDWGDDSGTPTLSTAGSVTAVTTAARVNNEDDGDGVFDDDDTALTTSGK